MVVVCCFKGCKALFATIIVLRVIHYIFHDEIDWVDRWMNYFRLRHKFYSCYYFWLYFSILRFCNFYASSFLWFKLRQLGPTNQILVDSDSNNFVIQSMSDSRLDVKIWFRLKNNVKIWWTSIYFWLQLSNFEE